MGDYYRHKPVVKDADVRVKLPFIEKFYSKLNL
jgi:hypothetical protein